MGGGGWKPPNARPRPVEVLMPRKRLSNREHQALRRAAVGGAISGLFRALIAWILDHMA